MQNVKAICFLCFLITALPFSVSAQETFVPENIFFQNEIIRKVSVGDGGVWVIKGADSTGVGKLEPDGRELDYTHTVNTSFPLTGIVGKYGDSAMIATKGNYLLMYNKGVVSRLDEENGIPHNTLVDIYGSPNYTRVATPEGGYESYDNQQFSGMLFYTGNMYESKAVRLGKSGGVPIIAYYARGWNCISAADDELLHVAVKIPQSEIVSFFPLNNTRKLNAIAINLGNVRSYNLNIFLGNEKGLTVRQWECSSPTTLLLQDTTVYSISNYKDKMLIGTEKGLFYCINLFPQNTYQIPLNDEYEIYDVLTQEKEGIIWIATNKGLLQLKEEHIFPPQEHTVSALEWAKSIGGILQESISSSITDKNGNFFITGHFEGAVNFGDTVLTTQNHRDFYLAKYNPQGQLIWARSAFNSGHAGKMMTEEGGTLALDSKGNVYATLKIYHSYGENEDWEVSFSPGITLPEQSGSGSYLAKFDKGGSAKWVKKLPFSAHLNFQMDTDYEDNLILSMELNENNPYNIEAGKGVLKFSSDFDLLWAKSFPGSLPFFKLKKNGEFYLFGNSYPNATIAYYNKSGNRKWGNNFEGDNGNQIISNIKDIGYDLQGNTFISGYNPTDSHLNIFVAKLNAVGNLEWARTGISGSDEISLEVDSLGNSYLNFNYWETAKIENHTFRAEDGKKGTLVAKYDYAGDFSWAYSVPGLSVAPNGMSITQNHDIYLSGTLTEDIKLNGELLTAKGETNIFLAKLSDTSSYFNRNLVRGKSYFDKNKNNIFDEGDEPVRDNIIKAEPGPVYARSDQNGNYYLFLDKGNYSIEQIIPEFKGKRITQTFPAQPHELNLSGTEADTAGFDFAHDVQLSPHLSVDVSSSRFRRCFKNTTVVEYCNEGFAAAENVQIELEYPDYVIPVSSDFHWSSKNGKKLTFNIGTLLAQQCKRIILTDSVMCGNESIRGLTQCIKATITPVPTTPPDPEWDESDIVLSAECKDNGFVRLNLQNNGNGDMADSAVFKIFLQEDLSYTGRYKLKKGENMSLNVLANGKPLHLEAELSPFHPQKKSVSISIHGCDEDGNPLVEHTFTNQFPQNDDQDHYEISCMEIIDSYDPNDKQVIPAGISANHYVKEGSLLEYTIRFQNTGTDTAYTVVITDFLDPNLDISSLHVSLSSHPVKWDLSGEEQANITWRFSNINLPDSTTNEKASHGFVKFKIRPKEEAGFGTAIKNKAAIYFDYNSPIITNETLTTLGIPESPSEEELTFQNCNVAVTLAQEEDVEVILCESNTIKLSRQARDTGRGRWRVIKGHAKIVDQYSHNTTAEDISYGENIFQWEVSYCDVLVRSYIKVKREALPAAPEINPLPELCQGDPLPVITATGEGIEWYSDPALTHLSGTGNTFQVKQLASQRMYVTQQNSLCKSQARVVEINVHPKPTPPAAPSVEACLETINDFRLTAEGNNLRWYADRELQNLLGEGDSFQPEELVSQQFFVTQSSDYCESDPSKVVFNTKTFDPSKAFFANVITPNGDEWNQLFYVRPFETEECLGNFIAVKIYNRMGKLLFQSNERSFQWDATKVKAGIYFYSMEYDLKKFNGYVQIIQ